jgi:hypothetical protein
MDLLLRWREMEGMMRMMRRRSLKTFAFGISSWIRYLLVPWTEGLVDSSRGHRKWKREDLLEGAEEENFVGVQGMSDDCQV